MFKFNFLVACLALGAISAVAAVPAESKSNHAVHKAAKKPAVKPAAPVVPVIQAELSPEQLLVSEKVVLGPVPCELGVKVVVKPDVSPGRFLLELGRQTYRMEPTLTTTGAVRLEDPAAGVVWLQLGNKSMLLNQRLGKRLADACVNGNQSAIASAMEKTKAPGLLDDATPSSTPPPPPSPLAR